MEGEPSFIPAEHQTKMWPGGPYGRTLHFGIREHAMGAIMNGITLHGGTRVYGGTFLVFSDYMRPPVRLAALMKLPIIYVWTHDSIGLGGDGPTHQPIEHLAALRAIPGLDVVRPADANETAVCWRAILENTDRPVGFALSRQNLPVLDPAKVDDARPRAATCSKRPRPAAPRSSSSPPAPRSSLALAARERARGRGHPDPGRVDAVRRVVRRAADVLPAAGAAARGQGAGQRRGRRSRRAGASSSATPARSISIEHFGASADGERPVRAVRLHPRPRRRRRARRARTRAELVRGVPPPVTLRRPCRS